MKTSLRFLLCLLAVILLTAWTGGCIVDRGHDHDFHDDHHDMDHDHHDDHVQMITPQLQVAQAEGVPTAG